MNNSPKVSVIIPVYNAEQYLPQCLDSVIRQTLKDIEIICVDDGSTDNSLSILQNYAKVDSRFIILKQNNQGAAIARNRGLAISKGSFVSILDADDFFSPNMLEDAYKKLIETNSEIVIFKAQLYNDKTKEYSKCTWAIRDNLTPSKEVFGSKTIKRYIFQFCNGWAWDKVFKREYLCQHNVQFQNTKIFNDTNFVFSALMFAQRISIVPKVCATKRRSVSTSISSTRSKNWKEFYKVIFRLEINLKSNKLFEEYKRSFLNYALHLALFVYQTIDNQAQKEMKSFLKSVYFPRYNFFLYPEGYFYNRKEYLLMQNIIEDKNQKYIENTIRQGKSSEYIKQSIPVVYATDDGYVRYTATSIDSIMQCSPVKQKYIFYILLPTDISEESKKVFLNLSNNYENCDIQLISVKEKFSNASLQIKHITVPTYYRLLLPDILPNVNKCIYLDGDTVVCQSLVELYELDLEENYIAGVEAYGYFRDTDKLCKRLGIPKFITYINAGVLVMDLEKMRKADCVSEFLALIDRKFSSQDQDIINVACYGKIKRLPYKYNVMTAHRKLGSKFLCQFIAQEDLEEALTYPVIIHYADKEKPWDTLYTPMANYWWNAVLSGTTWHLYSADKIPLLLGSNIIKREGDRLEVQKQKINDLKKEIENIHNSWTYKSGRFLTWLPRKCYGAMKCYHEHGLKYTLIRSLVHLNIKKENITSSVHNSNGRKVLKGYDYYKKLRPDQYASELKDWFKQNTGEELDLDNPKTYNEKIQWLKLYDSTPLKTQLADKYLVRDWVRSKIGDQYLVKLLGVWDKFDDIDFDRLPNSFVLKANHGCGWNIIVKDKSKFDIMKAKNKFDSWMKSNFAFRVGLELQYMNIPPKIIAEEYMENGNNDLYDYKVFCFGGKAQSIMFLSERKTGLKMAFYDLNWQKLPFVYSYPRNEAEVPKPKNLNLMVQLAEKLAQGFAHVRVDFYVLNDGSLKFGEMTFTSASGTCKWNPPEQNLIYGNLITLPPRSPIPRKENF